MVIIGHTSGFLRRRTRIRVALHRPATAVEVLRSLPHSIHTHIRTRPNCYSGLQQTKQLNSSNS